MPTKIIPLTGVPTTRGPWGSDSLTAVGAGKDQRFINCIPAALVNSVVGNKSIYCMKRPGLELAITPNAGAAATAIFISPSLGLYITAWGASNSTIFKDTVNCGTITGKTKGITETVINSVTFWLMVSSDGTGWFLASDSISDTSFTGDTHTNTTIDNIAGSGGVYVGQLITGNGIAANTRVATRTPDTTTPTSITTTVATTATAAGVTITKTPIAKIIDANFPIVAGNFCEMDGYVFVMGSVSGNSQIHNSDLNSVTSWGADNYISCNAFTDSAFTVSRLSNKIIAFGVYSTEYFYNAGNPVGSPLSRLGGESIKLGGGYPIAECNNNIFFLGSGQGGTGSIYRYDGSSLKRISTSVIESVCVIGELQFDAFDGFGQICLHIGVTSFGIHYIYFSALDIWMEWSFTQDVRIAASGGNIFFVQTSGTTGKVYYIRHGNNLYQDDSAAYSMTIQTEAIALNKGKGFIINSVELLADNQTSGATQLEICRNDYGRFDVLGNFQLTNTRKRITRVGFCRNHAIFRLTDSGNQAWRGQALVVNWTPCAT